jgi:hypothetical protein
MLEKITLDTRELPAPLPLEKIVQTLPQLNNNNYIHMIHRQEPNLLFEMLDKNNFAYKAVRKNDELFEIFIAINKNILSSINN